MTTSLCATLAGSAVLKTTTRDASVITRCSMQEALPVSIMLCHFGCPANGIIAFEYIHW